MHNLCLHRELARVGDSRVPGQYVVQAGAPDTLQTLDREHVQSARQRLSSIPPSGLAGLFGCCCWTLLSSLECEIAGCHLALGCALTACSPLRFAEDLAARCDGSEHQAFRASSSWTSFSSVLQADIQEPDTLTKRALSRAHVPDA